MSPTTRNTLPKHSTGWGVMRLISDRGGKNVKEHPAAWGKHRHVTRSEAFAILANRYRSISAMITPRETRP